MNPPLAAAGLTATQVRAGGASLPSHYEIRGLTVTREVNRIPSARLVLLDGDAAEQDFPASAERTLQPGKDIEILAGYGSSDQSIFKGVITRLRIRASRRGASELIIECKDKCVALTGTRKSACFTKKTDDAVMLGLIRGAGLTGEVESTSITHEELVQFNATDWDFMASRAEANGRLVFVNDGRVEIKEPQTTAQPSMELHYGVNLFEFEAQLEDSGIAGSSDVRAEAWNATTQQAEESGKGSKLHLQHGGSRSRDELKSWAAAVATRVALARVRGRARVQGDGSLLPGQVVKLAGMGQTFSGRKLFVSAVAHDIANGEWFTDVQFGLSPEWFTQRPDVAQPAAAGLLPPVTGLQIGVVASITGDPEKEFRVQVKLPLVDADGQGVWARVARPDAGSNRGTVFLPEAGDEVVLGFLHGDPRDAIVLGMLHSSKHPSPLAADEKNTLKGITTREKLQLMFDDEGKVLTIATPAGNSILLDEKNKKLTITDQNQNSVVMSGDGIKLTGKSHTVELGSSGVKVISAQDLVLSATGSVTIEGAQIEAKAKAQFKASGAAGAEVSSSGIAVLKGTLVQIN